MTDTCVLENVARGRTSIAICPDCNLHQNTNNFAAGNQVGSHTDHTDLICDYGIQYDHFGKPHCITFDGTGKSCGEPEPICMPDSDGDGISNCFQLDWEWEKCDPATQECPCDAFVRSPIDDSPLCTSCSRCKDDSMAWDCYNVEHAMFRTPYRNCDRQKEVCEPGTDGFLKCVKYNAGCRDQGCTCNYSVRDPDLNKLDCNSCEFCQDGSIAYDCTEFGQGFRTCDEAKPVDPQPSDPICLPDSDKDGVVNCFQFDEGWENCDPSKEDCPCEAFVRSKKDGDSQACHSCQRCSDDTLAWCVP